MNEQIDIARATIDDEIWRQGPAAVFAEIKRLEKEILGGKEPDWDFFLSYSADDEGTARKIAAVVEGEGYSVFSQFQNMPAGANFVREMQKGLAGSSRFIAVLSPNYESSDHCQAEWAAAYNADPSGRDRKLVPFLIQLTNLNPLAEQVVYVPLIGLSDEAAAKKIREALTASGPVGQGLRASLSDVASPEPQLSDDGRLDAGANETYDRPVVDDDLVTLPLRQRSVIRTIQNSFSKTPNAPKILSYSFNEY